MGGEERGKKASDRCSMAPWQLYLDQSVEHESEPVTLASVSSGYRAHPLYTRYCR